MRPNENTQLFVPKRIKVGFQNRDDTYTKRLSYVIYYDNKNILRKEKSWEGWRDKNIPAEEYDNKPTEGFVINKNVGGKRYSYSHFGRNEYVRIYDPRNFEFEISIANLLFILQESNSLKGKGLEGEFVYAWNGTELALLPVKCQEYEQCLAFTEIQHKHITKSQLIPGCIYQTRKQEQYIYMGRFPWYEYKYDYKTNQYSNNRKLVYVFDHTKNDTDSDFNTFNSLDGFATQLTTDPVEDYAARMDALSKHQCMSPAVNLIHKPIKIEFDPTPAVGYYNQCGHFKPDTVYYLNPKGKFERYHFSVSIKYGEPCTKVIYACNKGTFSWENNALHYHDNRYHNYERNKSLFGDTYGRDNVQLDSIEPILSKDWYELFIVLENGIEIPLSQYAYIY